jgi:hypothetical protein
MSHKEYLYQNLSGEQANWQDTDLPTTISQVSNRQNTGIVLPSTFYQVIRGQDSHFHVTNSHVNIDKTQLYLSPSLRRIIERMQFFLYHNLSGRIQNLSTTLPSVSIWQG